MLFLELKTLFFRKKLWNSVGIRIQIRNLTALLHFMHFFYTLCARNSEHNSDFGEFIYWVSKNVSQISMHLHRFAIHYIYRKSLLKQMQCRFVVNFGTLSTRIMVWRSLSLMAHLLLHLNLYSGSAPKTPKWQQQNCKYQDRKFLAFANMNQDYISIVL